MRLKNARLEAGVYFRKKGEVVKLHKGGEGYLHADFFDNYVLYIYKCGLRII